MQLGVTDHKTPVVELPFTTAFSVEELGKTLSICVHFFAFLKMSYGSTWGLNLATCAP